MSNIAKVLSDLGFHFHPKRAIKWRAAQGVGTVKGLPSLGHVHALATDGVHMIVQHGDGHNYIEIHQTNWEGEPITQSVAKPLTKVKKAKDTSAAALTRLMADLE